MAECNFTAVIVLPETLAVWEARHRDHRQRGGTVHPEAAAAETMIDATSAPFPIIQVGDRMYLSSILYPLNLFLIPYLLSPVALGSSSDHNFLPHPLSV